MDIRPARAEDALGMSLVLGEIIARWKSRRPSAPDHVLGFYVEHRDKIECLVALDESALIIGFQSLKRAVIDNPFGVSPGWGIIGTYVAQNYAGRGIGRKLFANTCEAAKSHGLSKIDATIGKTNRPGLAYYDAMGFQTYRTTQSAISKFYLLT